MANLAIVPILSASVFKSYIAGQTPLAHLQEKLATIRELDKVIYVGGSGLLEQLAGQIPPAHERWTLTDPYQAPLLSLRKRFNQPTHLQDNYLFCHPSYPFLPGVYFERALHAILGDYKGAVTTLPPCYAFKNGSGLSLHQRNGLDACIAVRGGVGVERDDLWFFGEKVDYIPVSAIEAISIDTLQGEQIAQALVTAGEV